MNLLTDEEFYETMSIINNSSQHLSNTIDDFRNFFSADKEITSFNLNMPIEKVLKLIDSRLKTKDIEVVKNSVDLNIIGLENEFIQVILNILNNSIDAFKNSNYLKKLIFIDISKDKNNAIIIIKDNAGGIKEDIINRIFEPYFTTKHKSQGTGIGLYMSLEIIQKHMHGTLSASNEEFNYDGENYKGAMFKIVLPLDEK